MAEQKEQTPAEKFIGDFSPEFIRLTDDVLFGEVWERPGLSKRDRSLATISTLIALRAIEQLPGHIQRGLDNGLTREEIVELITHMAFYAGWPSAFSAVGVAKKLFEAGNQR